MDNFEEVNKPRVEDFLFKGGKTLVGMLPVAGPVLSELFSYAISDPIQTRINNFISELNDRVAWLEENKRVQLESLLSNDLFIDVVIQATSYATKTSEEEKRLAFKNVITNTALGFNPDEIKARIFVKIVDGFTGWHLRVLYFINDPRKAYDDAGMPIPNYYSASILSALINLYSEFSGEDDLLEIIWSDLSAAGFHRSGSLKTGMTGDGVFSSRTTELGKEFIRYISFDEE
ncbi:hypothetical protein L0657_04860 [Dyadobacter sp. CY345]|uniref:hypothetical protein n=1 Tax=Dyadobacter sp. CY345 TaxID=2909335 RepID=UPI001F481425|nr:hypothetical protein [Dyadobacter sp. CY345]MCF2443278.1 hypothetical protein [Dyadobacter sp. CY345]